MSVQFVLRNYGSDGDDREFSDPQITVGEEWQRVEKVATMNGPGMLEGYVRATSGAVDECYLVDDVVVSRVP